MTFVLFYVTLFQTNTQIYRERIKILKAKLNARNERIKLVIQRGTPDVDPLES